LFLSTLEAYRRKYNFRVHAYALLPDHYHLMVSFPPHKELVNFLRDFKSMVGKKVVAWLLEEKLDGLLACFQLRKVRRRPRDAQYCVLQYNSYVKPVLGVAAIRQKLQYIHLNPVRAGLAATPEAYPYSSAPAYAGKGLTWVKIDRLELPYD